VRAGFIHCKTHPGHLTHTPITNKMHWITGNGSCTATWSNQKTEDMSAKDLFTCHTILALILWCLTLGAQAPIAPHTTSSDTQYAEITIENLAKELQRQGIVHWRVVLAQAVVEAGWSFESNVFRNSNNFIGMRVPAARPSRRVGTYNGYSAYATWQDCVADIRLWQQHFWKGGSREDYIAKLHRVWAEDPAYGSLLQKLVVKFETMFPSRA